MKMIMFCRYGAQHPIVVHKDTDETADYVVVGHCCESGDLFSCAPGDPEALQARKLKKAAIGDLVSIEGSGAYCSSMSTKNYNSFPEAAEVLVDEQGEVHLIRRFAVHSWSDCVCVLFAAGYFVF